MEKLKLINYEKEYCKRFNKKQFSRVYFAIPGANASHQFEDFTSLSAWLCSEISHKSDTFQPDELDDPNTIINKLILALRQFDFRSSFPVQKLKIAHGEAVCCVLDFLIDKLVLSRGFQWNAPVHLDIDQV